MTGLDILRPRVSHTTCARCRQLFKAGDRTLIAYIIKNPNTRDPQTRELSIEMTGEFEFVHASCTDPSLEGRTILTT